MVWACYGGTIGGSKVDSENESRRKEGKIEREKKSWIRLTMILAIAGVCKDNMGDLGQGWPTPNSWEWRCEGEEEKY